MFRTLLQSTAETTNQVDQAIAHIRKLKARPSPPPSPLLPLLLHRPPLPLLHPPPPGWLDLNLASNPTMRPSLLSGERPNGHGGVQNHRDVGDGILESHLPHTINGTLSGLGSQFQLMEDSTILGNRYAPFSKVEARGWRRRQWASSQTPNSR